MTFHFQILFTFHFSLSTGVGCNLLTLGHFV